MASPKLRDFNLANHVSEFKEIQETVCHESIGVARNYTKDEGRSLGVGLQEQAPNHLKLLW